MLGQPGPAADPYELAGRRVRTLVVLAAAGWLVVAVLLLSPLPAEVRRAISGTVLVFAGLGLAATCHYRFRHGTGRRRTAWLLWTVAALAGAFRNLWIWIVGIHPPNDQVTPADIATALALALVAVGFGFFTSTTKTSLGLGRMLLDGAVLGGSVLLLTQSLAEPGLLLAGEQRIRDLAGVVTVIFDLMVATLAALQFMRAGRDERPAMGFAALAFTAFAASDLGTALQRDDGPLVSGTAVDLGYIAGWMLLAFGVAWSVPPLPADSSAAPSRSEVGGTIATFGVFLVAAGLHLAIGAGRTQPVAANVLLVVVLVAVATRQALLILDNERLRTDLLERVRERSSELREVTQRTDVLVDSVGDGVYGVDANGKVTFVNPAASAVLGYRPRELMGQSAHQVFHTREGSERGHDAVDCYIGSVVTSGTPVAGLADNYLSRDGRSVPVEVTASPLAKDVRARGAVVVFRDVTQRREVERLKNEFVSMVSHELKTPLTAIRGSLGLLGGGALGPLAPPARRMVDIAMDSSERLTRLINQILDLERMESGTMAMNLATHRAADLIRRATDQLQVLAENDHLSVVVISCEGTVLADADQAEQTLVNLLGNAVKFSPPNGRIEVGAAMTGTEVEFWVSDQGRGIPEDQLDTIFDRFHQVDSSDARQKGGSGLGLAISRSIVERLGGRIWAQNSPAGGATFRFTLPAGLSFGSEPEQMSERTTPT